jgi:hypothetical protein
MAREGAHVRSHGSRPRVTDLGRHKSACHLGRKPQHGAMLSDHFDRSCFTNDTWHAAPLKTARGSHAHGPLKKATHNTELVSMTIRRIPTDVAEDRRPPLWPSPIVLMFLLLLVLQVLGHLLKEVISHDRISDLCMHPAPARPSGDHAQSPLRVATWRDSS